MIAVDLFGKNTRIDLSVAYSNLTNLKSSVSNLNVGFSKIQSLSSLSSLSSLTSDILNLSNSITVLNSGVEYIWGALQEEIVPIILSNSSSIDSLSSSLLSVNSSLSDITNSLSTLTRLTYNTASLDNNIRDLKMNTSILGNSINNLSNSVAVQQTLSSLSTLTSLTNDIASLNNNTIDLKMNTSNLNNSINSLKTLSTLIGVYTAESFNNQAFNTTFNLNSDMFFTGQFGLNTGSINCSSGIWDLKELKPTTLSSITATYLSNLKMENFKLSAYDLHYSNKCYFDDCSLLNCGVNGKKCVFENCFISGGNLDNRMMEFKFDSFSNSIHIWNGGVFSFCNVDFYTDNFKFIMHGNGRYRIYIMDCLIYGTTNQAAAFTNMFSNAAGVNIEFAMY